MRGLPTAERDPECSFDAVDQGGVPDIGRVHPDPHHAHRRPAEHFRGDER
jgi:hypothetical protein